MISLTAKYALRAVVFLAKQTDEFTSRVAIAEATMVPVDYLLKVLNGLEFAGIVGSRRGPGGGYRLNQPIAKLTVLDVVTSVDVIPRIKECPLGITSHRKLCPLHQLLDNASALVEDSFRKTTIADLLETTPKGCDFPD